MQEFSAAIEQWPVVYPIEMLTALIRSYLAPLVLVVRTIFTISRSGEGGGDEGEKGGACVPAWMRDPMD